MIRAFKADDMPQLVQLLAGLHAQTPYRCVKPDWPQVVGTITMASAKQTGCVFVADHGRITGTLIGVAQQLWWQNDHGARIASDLIFHSKRPGDGVQMLNLFKEWAFQVPRVIRVECGISSGEDEARLARIYLDAGFKREGSFFIANHPRYEAALKGLKEVA